MEPTEHQKALLKLVVEHFDKEDRAVRDRQIRTFRKLKLLWSNLQHHYYSEVAHDWRVPEIEREGADNDQTYYDKPVNIFRAYLESIIAALSVTVPPITCYPDDADNPLDVLTAKAGDKIAGLIFKHNKVSLLWLHALFIYCTEGMIACYSYPKEDESFGTYEENEYETVDEVQESSACPQCGFEFGNEPVEPRQQMNEAQGMMSMEPEQEMCPQCQMPVTPVTQQNTVQTSRIKSTTTKAKSRVLMEVYGGLYVKVPNYARRQCDCPYLMYSYETHYSNVIEKYPECRLHVEKGARGAFELYEQWGRLSPQYYGEYPINNVTVRNTWLRPSAFNVLEEEQTNALKKLYPDGVKVVMVNDYVADAVGEKLDDRWTLTYNPLSDYIHFDPLGLLLTSVQELTNDLLSLTVQTIEHGIPQTFANPKVLNFKAYRETEVVPGGIYPATPPVGKTMGDGFYEVKTATLSGEVLPFTTKVQEIGQMVSGALPSLFGGQLTGSRTASEYGMSRAQALQRLQNTWKMLTDWWKDIFGKVIPLYISEVKEDERSVEKDKFGNFINVFVRKSELEGKIGAYELEANENLPVTWSQQKDTTMELLQTNNEQILATLMDVENLPMIKKSLGLMEFIIPGEDDRQKQYDEIVQLLNSQPLVLPPDPMMEMQAMANGMPPPMETELPSVDIDVDVDNHELEADICRRWLVSDAGRLAKIENIDGYKNVLLHMKAHKEIAAQQMMQQMLAQGVGGAAPEGPMGKGELKRKQQAPPIKGAEDVNTIQ